MSSFKAANPGALFEDFVRWYSPRDWNPLSSEANSTSSDANAGIAACSPSFLRGVLSGRMSQPGNHWHSLWLKADPVPAALQSLLFDPAKEAERGMPESAFILYLMCFVS